MMDRWCEVCAMSHDRCEKCGALVVASVYLHRKMDAHGASPHWCGAENPRYQAMLRAMREESDGCRELLTECGTCGDDVIRKANSPVLYEIHGYYGLQGESAVHNCAEREIPPTPIRTPIKEEPAIPFVGTTIPRLRHD